MISLTNENKNTLGLSMEQRGSNNMTWDEANFSWDEAVGTWDAVGTVMTKESKNSLSLNFENK